MLTGKPLMTYSGINTYLLTVGLQCLAQCIVGKMFSNKCMAVLAWSSTLLYQRNIKSKPDIAALPSRSFLHP